MVTLTFEEFQSILSEKGFKIEAQAVVIRPFLWISTDPVSQQMWKAHGSIEIQGLLRDDSLRIDGYDVSSKEPLDPQSEAKRFVDLLELDEIKTIRQLCTGGTVRIDDVVVTLKNI